VHAGGAQIDDALDSGFLTALHKDFGHHLNLLWVANGSVHSSVAAFESGPEAGLVEGIGDPVVELEARDGGQGGRATDDGPRFKAPQE